MYFNLIAFFNPHSYKKPHHNHRTLPSQQTSGGPSSSQLLKKLEHKAAEDEETSVAESSRCDELAEYLGYTCGCRSQNSINISSGSFGPLGSADRASPLQESGCCGLADGRTPTCRMRFWCSGGPPSRDVLLEVAIFKSRSELPPLERLPSELCDILSAAEGSLCLRKVDVLRRGGGGGGGGGGGAPSESTRLGRARAHSVASHTVLV
ncbi:hypothetical protein EYF80_032043 [Liparis tanakae]|uniref:Uncharacterized protein n=1 Tax=Liparis tanakae TaxID=230148 RepID=A0A4Z2GXC6_9TELE|nr:hypothetical protein EYF80_032043 [Liparis tanakae]